MAFRVYDLKKGAIDNAVTTAGRMCARIEREPSVLDSRRGGATGNGGHRRERRQPGLRAGRAARRRPRVYDAKISGKNRVSLAVT